MSKKRYNAILNIDLKNIKDFLPDKPGVYFFKDTKETIIYVGKAKSLKKRVSSYFAKKHLTNKIVNMMNKAKSLEFIVTSNEKEALLLESNLIKKFEPKYNVVLRDDKRYPCIRLDMNEPFPRLIVTRKIERDGAIYFGPFHSASSMRNTLRFINKTFKLRSCKNIPKNKRPCLNYQIGQCLGPCTGEISEQDYMDMVNNARLFLEGKGKELIEKLTKDMMNAANKLEFEKAARIRDQIKSIKKVLEKQQMISSIPENIDVIGIAYQEDIYQVLIFIIREGYMIGSKKIVLQEKDSTMTEIIEAFIKQYYPHISNVPDEIIVPIEIEEKDIIADWISELSNKNIKITYPLSKRKKELLYMAMKNAEEMLYTSLKAKENGLLVQMKEVLNLKKVPNRIEAIDISQIRGKQAVGCIVTFLNGKPYKKGYRNFRIKGNYIDDYSMMVEVIKKRVKKGDLPDLFIIDGGKGHLTAIKNAIIEEGIQNTLDLIAIAKSDKVYNRSDKIYLVGKKSALQIPNDHPVLLFIMKIRDEVHRRAITYHRKLRNKEEIYSILNDIPGIGEKRMKQLLREFKDINEIIKASIEEITKISGINTKLAHHIKSYICKNKKNN